MALSPSVFDKILATGDSGKVPAPGFKPDVFGVNSLSAPISGVYESLADAVASLRKAREATKPR